MYVGIFVKEIIIKKKNQCIDQLVVVVTFGKA